MNRPCCTWMTKTLEETPKLIDDSRTRYLFPEPNVSWFDASKEWLITS